MFAELAREFHLSYIPFFLENIIENRRLLQEDELHPTAAAQPLLLKEILPTINKVLEEDVKQPASQ